MYYIKNTVTGKFVYEEDGCVVDFVNRTSFASSFDTIKEAKDFIKCVGSDLPFHITDSYGCYLA